MIVTISTTHRPATDLGFLLRKHPDRVQEFPVTYGTAHVFYPEATEERCTVALLLDVDGAALARSSKGAGPSDFTLGQYVNDRPYAASSLLAVAIKRVFSSAFSGTLESNPELAAAALPLEIHLPALPCPGGADGAQAYFAPLGWEVTATELPLDPAFPDWGRSRFVDLTLRGEVRLADALSQLYVLIPALDRARHYWVGEDDVDKLMRHGAGWLAAHPLREDISERYLVHQRSLVNDARDRLLEIGDQDADALAVEDDAEPAVPEPRRRLVHMRHDAVLAELRALRSTAVADVGCGDGALLRPMLEDPSFTRIVGTDVSAVALARAERRLNLERRGESQTARLELFQSSLTYRDARLAGLDALVLMEVVEHVDWDRLPALEAAVFEHARPQHVLVTTPNAEYNALYEGLEDGAMRHPDHRWELTRAQFADWTATIAARYGYLVRYVGIGDEDGALGHPTQMAIFTQEARS
ncbi:MAG: 3' terminal RNA ribose 2'-O-methyltransferase Hen1 [Demequina sp.]